MAGLSPLPGAWTGATQVNKKLKSALKDDRALLKYFDDYVRSRTVAKKQICKDNGNRKESGSISGQPTNARGVREQRPTEAVAVSELSSVRTGEHDRLESNHHSNKDKIVKFLSDSMGFDRAIAAVAHVTLQ